MFASAGCSSEGGPPPEVEPLPTGDDVIVAIGHGRYLGSGFKLLEPSPELFERTQRALIARMTAGARAVGLDVDGARASIAGGEADPFVANAKLIDWLLEYAPPGDHATIQTINVAMRHVHGDTSVAERVTFNSGQKYIDECRDAGVPIPPPM
jgi:hypothetical protein